MKRFHVHTFVADLQTSIDFYAQLFGVAPTRVEEADWRDPQGPQRGLEVWLLAAGQAHCYRARLDGSAAWPRS